MLLRDGRHCRVWSKGGTYADSGLCEPLSGCWVEAELKGSRVEAGKPAERLRQGSRLEGPVAPPSSGSGAASLPPRLLSPDESLSPVRVYMSPDRWLVICSSCVAQPLNPLLPSFPNAHPSLNVPPPSSPAPLCARPCCNGSGARSASLSCLVVITFSDACLS